MLLTKLYKALCVIISAGITSVRVSSASAQIASGGANALEQEPSANRQRLREQCGR